MKREAKIEILKQKLIDEHQGNCPYCLLPIHFDKPETFNIDHIIPKSKGGTEEMTNLTLCHVECNKIKKNKIINKDIKKKDFVAYKERLDWNQNNKWTYDELWTILDELLEEYNIKPFKRTDDYIVFIIPHEGESMGEFFEKLIVKPQYNGGYNVQYIIEISKFGLNDRYCSVKKMRDWVLTFCGKI